MTMMERGEPSDEQEFGGTFSKTTFYHEKREEFRTKEEARQHARNLKWLHTFPVKTRIQKRPDGAYWVWVASK